MTAKGHAVRVHRPVGQERLEDPVGGKHSADHAVRRGHSLRAGDQIGPDRVAVAAEPLAEPAESGDHLIGAEQDSVAVADLADALEVPGGRYPLPTTKIMVNVGSVGQPRDGDARACYVLLTDNLIEFRRVPYEVEKTAAKIYAISELDPFLGDRLKEGR